MSGAARKRILIVEDEEALARFLQLELESQGFEVRTAERGAPALRDAADHRPDLAILDLRLPDMSGYDVCRELRRLCSPWPIPIVMFTAMGRPIDRLRGFSSGADVYLTKPCDLAELGRTVSGLLEETLTA